MRMDMPGVVPLSAKYLDLEDPDGNQIYRLTVMSADLSEYQKILKKNGFNSQQFTYDSEQYVANKRLESQLKQEMKTLNGKILNTT
jgi:hypothetical protein